MNADGTSPGQHPAVPRDAAHLRRGLRRRGRVRRGRPVFSSLVEHQFGLAATGEQAREHVRAAIRDVHRAVPDISFSIEDYAEQGDKIWVRVRARGTATGPFFGPPSNKPIDITVFDLARVAGGRIVERWGVPDRFALLAQTGLLDGLAR